MKTIAEHQCLRISAPELVQDQKFQTWLNAGSGYSPNGPRIATWHRPGDANGLINEYSDVFLWMEKEEGSDTDMPEHVWKELRETAGENFVGVIWITFC